jgi:hypothetical protein
MNKTSNSKHPPVPAGWRLLNKGEIVKTGDKYVASSDWPNWHAVADSAGHAVGTFDAWQMFYITPGEAKVEVKHKPPRIRPQKGYRMLKKGEIIKAGDVFRHKIGGFTWDKVRSSIGKPAGSLDFNETTNLVFAREIKAEFPHCAKGVEPGEGYRLLALEETIQAGDEYESARSGWTQSSWAGDKVLPESSCYRRKLSTVTEEKPVQVTPVFEEKKGDIKKTKPSLLFRQKSLSGPTTK